jgi:hypothetical protein
MKQRESLIVKQIRKDLESIGAVVEKVADRVRVGVSDLSVCYKGFYVKIEVKASEDAEYKTVQCLHLVQHHRAGGIGVFAHPQNWEYLFLLIKEMPVTYEKLKRYGDIQVLALIEKKEMAGIKNPLIKQALPRGQQKQKKQMK